MEQNSEHVVRGRAASALVERRPDGGLLTAASAETFDVGDSAHMTAARDIERAVTPLNGTPPWELAA